MLFSSPTPHSERALRRARWNKLREKPPSLNFVSLSVPVGDMANFVEVKSDKSTPTSNGDKSCAHVVNQDQNHSPSQGVPPLGGNVSSGTSFKFRHQSRKSNLSNSTQDQKQQINFPPSSDKKRWKDIDSRLRYQLRARFHPNFISSHSTNQLATLFDDFLHNCFLEEFGPLPDKPQSMPYKSRQHRGLASLRRKKNELKFARRSLRKAGLADTDAYSSLSVQWFRLVREHNRLRVAVKKREKAKFQSEACRRFKKDPHAFAHKLFKDSSKSGIPQFSENECYAYFAKTYHDPGRDEPIAPLPEMSRPEIPLHIFSRKCPTLKELKRSARRKRNGAAAGLNSLTYVPYKCCLSILETLHAIVKKIWRTRDIPDDWATAFIILLSKTENLDNPADFRPIAITNTVGKIFFSVVSNRLQEFFIVNRFISNTQKGFLSGVPGCLEHSFTLFEALKDANLEQRQIVVTWIDLANAYGSIRHNLIQFALNWYHVPEFLQELIFNYYEKLKAKIKTNAWSTGFFLFDIGLFQGCVLSTILFDCVFQLLLDMLKPLSKRGYTFKGTNLTELAKAYADDLSLVTSTPRDNQTALDTTDGFLAWSKTGKAKPSKCVSLAFRQFDPRSDSGKYIPHSKKIYSAFDPLLRISNEPIRFIFDPRKKSDDLSRDHFKFLGRWIEMGLSESKIKTKVRSKFFHDMDKAEHCGVNGLMKLWLYEHYIVKRLAWPFFIFDFNRYFATELEQSRIVQLKRWAGLFRGADLGCLFRSRQNFGLQLTSIGDWFEQMQIIKCNLLENSSDPVVREVYQRKAKRVAGFDKRWIASKVAQHVAADADLALRFPTQEGRTGLGAGNFIGNPSTVDRRKAVITSLKSCNEEKRVAHAHDLARQGVWLKWQAHADAFDLSWQNLIYGPGPRLVAFVLNSMINSVCTPDMRKLWGYTKSASCHLCDHPQCTLHHIIANCPFALKQKRYTWRHDSVLKTIQLSLIRHISHHNESHVPKKSLSVPNIKESFNPAGSFKQRRSRSTVNSSMLDGASDWNLLVDFDHDQITFPPEIFPTSERPDIIIWSNSIRKVILIELTCPAEEGFEAASLRKDARYHDLVESINKVDDSMWSAILLTIEVGARGCVAFSTSTAFRKLGFTRQLAKSLCKSVSVVVARCSYALLLSTKNRNWDKNRMLISIKPSQAPATGDDQPPVKTVDFGQTDRQANLQSLKYHGIVKLYHFTDASNLASIQKLGLLSWFELEKRKLQVVAGGDQLSRDLDSCLNLQDYVRLSFVPNNPMMYHCLKSQRIHDPVVLEIDVEACLLPNTLFSDRNATKSGAFISPSAEVVRFDIVSKPNNFIPNVAPSEKHFFQAEVLIKNMVSPSLIKTFRRKAALDLLNDITLSVVSNRRERLMREDEEDEEDEEENIDVDDEIEQDEEEYSSSSSSRGSSSSSSSSGSSSVSIVSSTLADAFEISYKERRW